MCLILQKKASIRSDQSSSSLSKKSKLSSSISSKDLKKSTSSSSTPSLKIKASSKEKLMPKPSFASAVYCTINFHIYLYTSLFKLLYRYIINAIK